MEKNTIQHDLEGNAKSFGSTGNEREQEEGFLAVYNFKDITKVHGFLSGRQYNKVNNCKPDRKGRPMIGLMMKLDRFRARKRGLILCSNSEIFEKVMEIVEAGKESE